MSSSPAPDRQWRPEQRDDSWDPTVYLSGKQRGAGRRVIFDIEGDGLYAAQGNKKRGSELWCAGVIDIDSKEKFYWGVDHGNLLDFLEFLSEVNLALAHNGIGYDYRYLERWAWEKHGLKWKRPKRAWDTLIIAKTVWPAETLASGDWKRVQSGKMPAKYLKSHSLAAWGYRTGTHKVEYDGGFDEWCPAMASYLMTGDLDGPMALWRVIEQRIGWAKDTPKDTLVWPYTTLEVENSVAAIVQRQEEDGVRFDREKAIALSRQLRNEQARLEDHLVSVFGSWWQPLDDPEKGEPFKTTTRRKMTEWPDVEMARVSEKTGKPLKPYVGPPLEEGSEGDARVRIERVTFNPGSRDHLGQRLAVLYGWKPKKFGKDGKPSVDETTLQEIPDAVIPPDIRKAILDYFVVTKTIGMLSKGARSWLGLCDPITSRIHGRVDTVGTPTRRATHNTPNLSQTPAVRKEKVVDPETGKKKEIPLHGLEGRFGWECRELFCADEGWEQTGIDASSLELIDLGHYLAPYDEGLFSARVCDPNRDPHQEHSEITGTARADAKTAIYLKIYGGSAFKLSLDPAILVSPDEVPTLLGYKGLPSLLKSLERRSDVGPEFVARMDDMQKARLVKARKIIMALEAGIPGLKDLTEAVTQAASKGWLKAIDGSRIIVRKPHAALNSLLQSAGAITCKLWMHLVHQELEQRGYQWGRDYRQILWAHDELQFTHRPGLGREIAEIAAKCMVQAGEELGLRGRYRSDAKHGRNWAECH